MRRGASIAAHAARATVLMAGVVFAAGCDSIACSGIQYNEIAPMPFRQEPVVVTADDERAHHALEWIARQVAGGHKDATRYGRRLALDLTAYAHEKNQDFAAIPTPVFIVRGVPVLLRPVSRCLI